MEFEYLSHAEMLSENYDDLVEDGKKIRAICDDTGIGIEEFHAIFEVHTVFCYTTGIKEFYKSNREYALKSVDLLLDSISNPFSEEPDSIEENLAYRIGNYISELERNSNSRVEDFFSGVLKTTKKLYESEEFLDSTITKYFGNILPKMGFYTEDVVERSFELARERERNTDFDILSKYGLEDLIQ